MPDKVTIERVVIFAKMSDGTVKEVFIPEKDQTKLIKNLLKTYSPLRIVRTDLNDKIEFVK